ncbi:MULTISPECIES: helicase C-terminal domain-containing protein [Streptomyces]|uniref:helicase C-terminal domain-containing protein n=1 Tax=Streptomyces TaxID=1883 RepID=UPI000B511925|nr:helicase C-terminal domain-containing protein [Streptomyces sp. PgraA7]MYW99881.1 DEAD/DEAH box helicase [Streptomyces sp. SID8378]SNB89848.1 Replicative superfamily II helicase [Streptomyces sp. PgraA7]
MPLDWSLVGAGETEPLLRPRDIYAAGPRPWPYLRHEQGEVLDRWFELRPDKDVVIKQNTGGGKTAAGLLIAQSTLNEGVGKAVYLAGDTHYASGQVQKEALKLGLATTTNPRDPTFQQEQAILVTNFKKLFNGMSAFGVAGDSSRPPMPLGVVVVDDAHAALNTITGQFQLFIPRGHKTHDKLVDMFAQELRRQAPKQWRDVQAGDYSALVRVPFWAWANRHQEVMDLLHPHSSDDEFKYAWPLIADVLHLCAASVTSRGVEVRPPCPPVRAIPAFTSAQRRVYLTATLADDSALSTVLDADPALLARPVTPGSAADLGDRLILAPLSLNPSLGDEAMRLLARQFADGDRDGDGVAEAKPVNVVVIVPSSNRAAVWAPYAHRIHYAATLDAGVEELRETPHVGLVVLVNKYDGIDLPDDACRLLILDGVPLPLDAAERREAAALPDSRFRVAQGIQRIEQGMGRGVRDREDYCAVLLMGAELGMAIHDPRRLDLFSPATRAQLKVSRSIADQIAGEGLGQVREVIDACLERRPQWVTASRRALADVQYDQMSTVRADAVASRQAFDLAAVGQYQSAVSRLQAAINGLEDKALRGYLMEQKAAYLHHVDPLAAQQALTTAVVENPMVQRPVDDVAPRTIKAAAVQARAAAEYLRETYSDGVQLVLGVRHIFERFVWGDKDRADDAEAAWELLGRHLGFRSDRPEKIFKMGPDNRWALTSDQHAIIELKTGSTSDSISKDDADQLGGSVRWHESIAPGVRAQPVMLHPSSTLHKQSPPMPGLRVVTPTKLDELREAVVGVARALASGYGRWGDEQAVAAELQRAKLTAGAIISAYSETGRPAPS